MIESINWLYMFFGLYLLVGIPVTWIVFKICDLQKYPTLFSLVLAVIVFFAYWVLLPYHAFTLTDEELDA